MYWLPLNLNDWKPLFCAPPGITKASFDSPFWWSAFVKWLSPSGIQCQRMKDLIWTSTGWVTDHKPRHETPPRGKTTERLDDFANFVYHWYIPSDVECRMRSDQIKKSIGLRFASTGAGECSAHIRFSQQLGDKFIWPCYEGMFMSSYPRRLLSRVCGRGPPINWAG